MNKRLHFFIFLCIFNSAGFIRPSEVYNKYVISGASYFIRGVVDWVCSFYTYNGKKICIITNKKLTPYSVESLKKMLDPNAPKPQPISYKISYMPPIKISCITICKKYYSIIFYDESGNIVEKYYAYEKDNRLKIEVSKGRSKKTYDFKSILQGKESDFPLDLSIVKEIEENKEEKKKLK